ncbi:hypothetical protein FOA52_004869 [Chlamydomonas sp. UWO 241]|nr:hypothetical protein FOA52_004869 [Chlamydomonas sp. UWO 241]
MGGAAPLLEAMMAPVWCYSTSTRRCVWANRAAQRLWTESRAHDLYGPQPDSGVSGSWSPQEAAEWEQTNARLHQEVEVKGQELRLSATKARVLPGVDVTVGAKALSVVYTPVAVSLDGAATPVCMVQLERANVTHLGLAPDSQMRMTEMCDNHPMFQFLFDSDGNVLAANKGALANMADHLGPDPVMHTLLNYIALGEPSSTSGSPAEIFHECIRAIFELKQACHRIPQMRRSTRNPGKKRWVLFEMWPLIDPTTGQRAMLVCEQNISQVKSLEEKFVEEKEHLEAQLHALEIDRLGSHVPAIDIDTPADKAVKLLDKILRGEEVTPREASLLKETIIHAGDLRHPTNFSEQLVAQSHNMLDIEVGESLVQLLSSQPRGMEMQMGGGAGGAAGMDMAHGSPGRPRRKSAAPSVVSQQLMLSKNMPEKMLVVMAKIDDWQFDAFELDDASDHQPLSMLSFYLFRRFGLIAKFGLDEHKLIKFFMHLEQGYSPNPYHNRIHAADVLRSMHVLLCGGGIMQASWFDDLSLMACYLSAIMHDYEHRGVNNDFLVKNADDLALLYNDKSPMENHHLAASFLLLQTEEFNFMAKMPKQSKDVMRKMIIDMVLATDMKQHFAIHSMFQSLKMPTQHDGSVRTSPSGPRQSGSNDGMGMVVDDDARNLCMQMPTQHDGSVRTSPSGPRQSGSNDGMGMVVDDDARNLCMQMPTQHDGSVRTSPSGPRQSGSNDGMGMVVDDDARNLCMQLCLKCADLGHLASPQAVHKRWVLKLEEELFRQGDRERATFGVVLSPLMDREKNGITMSQVGFFDIVALPLFQSFATKFPFTTPMLDAVRSNYAMWREELPSTSRDSSNGLLARVASGANHGNHQQGPASGPASQEMVHDL